MSSIGDVEDAYNTLIKSGATNVSLLHCTSSYPASYDSVNLRAMDTLREAFKTDVGYSDHTPGIAVPIAAVARGAKIIEKHFTIDKSLPGPDHKASLDPSELKEMVTQIRNIEMSLGDGVKRIQDNELETRKVVSRGIYARKDISMGDTLHEKNVVFLRPAGEIPVRYFKFLEGRRILNNINKNDIIRWRDIDFE
jgi:sialic acid synthase SpsE